jgi:hypothetical protein
VPTDVHIPSFPARAENATLRDHITLLRDNFLNTLKNISRCDSLSLLVKPPVPGCFPLLCAVLLLCCPAPARLRPPFPKGIRCANYFQHAQTCYRERVSWKGYIIHAFFPDLSSQIHRRWRVGGTIARHPSRKLQACKQRHRRVNSISFLICHHLHLLCPQRRFQKAYFADNA